VTAHARVVGRLHGLLSQANVSVATIDLDDALRDVPTVELAAVLAERWAGSPSQHAFVRMPAVPTPGFTLVERSDLIFGTPTAPFADWEDAKREATILNGSRPHYDRWWVVADGAGVPLNPQP